MGPPSTHPGCTHLQELIKGGTKVETSLSHSPFTQFFLKKKKINKSLLGRNY